MIKSREEGVRERSGGEEGAVRDGVRGERESCGPSKFSIPRTSRDKLQFINSDSYLLSGQYQRICATKKVIYSWEKR